MGRETAKQLKRDGHYRLILLGRLEARMETALKELGAGPDEISTYVCDLGNADEIQATVKRIQAAHKSLWGLVNNAGIYPFGNLSSTTSESWDETMNVNIKAPFLLCKAFAPLIAKGRSGGRIVNISSTAGILPNHFALAYSVSKAAMIQLSRTLAKELGKDGITVNCICPAIVRSPIHEAYHATRKELEEFYQKYGARYPLGRGGEPADIAPTLKFFLF